MDKLEKLDMMDKILREFEDLRNSQTSVLKKISKIEADNINLGVKLLEEKLTDIFFAVDTNLNLVSELEEQFQEYRDKFYKDNNIAAMQAERE
ncbi:MAG TPA: hypothetical protein DEQ87_04175 [Algoriphagus sp.]|jgi:hypothetical protein|uniref:hypothetical protein n=1 Tax=unclassified Algoriphagus TaxID=2641541 RepID=UPI000C536924|nr:MULTISPECIES: hypothetical protein [unclassified Algoriphagus]MAL12697.1 hypothetical protein [Algoriphagus sp.]MAN85365.1 hypothetical protein [Algoriphagus sp.]HAD53184.1 hypothetical protein [Algoriphagus sp.]HAH37557.1 hypothetical protein [Algoriphagus sp.]HAS58216.1 hypothetical protein [Algoriphagus sp.]|tara:strand:+ start:136 stop:414 length:279 start_codon:yes stop_codon:yes gene_type:complete